MLTTELQLIVGLGATGFSSARYLKEAGFSIAVADTRLAPPQLEEFKKTYPDVVMSLGPFDPDLFGRASRIILSPGVALHEPMIALQLKRGVPVIGDIELFAETAQAPVIAITGTNAKSTVTTLVGEMAKAAGYAVQVGGNLGVPALDLLPKKINHEVSHAVRDPNLFVLELSSFQLETTFSLRPQVATILNITPDHMDRYHTYADYQAAKHRVYQRCHTAVFNRDDVLTYCQQQESQNKLSFTLNTPGRNEFGLLSQHGDIFLAYEDQLLLPVSELPVKGQHYQANALSALALGFGFGLPFAPMLKVLREFKGLPHRCQFVREYQGVKWFNDSKGTNVGATLAAIEGLGKGIQGKLVLIAGGLGKSADFHPLIPPIERYVRHVILIGQAAPDLAKVIGQRVPITLATTMDEAVKHAVNVANKNDSVLLSPACASFDMFKGFEHRGNVFMNIVEAL